MPQPLAGLKVVDFTHVMAGPFATHFLRLLGAEVIKIETAAGDLMRYYGGDQGFADKGMGAPFIGANAGKKSIVLNLKSDAGREIANRLVAGADIVVENFRPGVMQKLGFGYEDCKARNPKLIYCSISGYGQAGPMRDYPAIDNVVQATSGMMDVSGDKGAEPMRFGVPAVDTYAATIAAVAILAAIAGRERFGEGQHIDVAMMDASLVLLFGAAMPYLVAGRPAERSGNVGFSGQPTSASFPAGDGRLISLGIVQQYQFVQFAKIVEKPEWLEDPRFATQESRIANPAEMQAELIELFSTADAEHWETLLSKQGIPCGVVRGVPDALDLEQVRGRGLRMTVPGNAASAENVEILNAGFKFAANGPGHSEPAPKLGEHGTEILRGLGYGEEEAENLLAAMFPAREAA